VSVRVERTRVTRVIRQPVSDPAWQRLFVFRMRKLPVTSCRQQPPNVGACRLYYSPNYSPEGVAPLADPGPVASPANLPEAADWSAERARLCTAGSAVATCSAARSAACRHGAWRRAISAGTLRRRPSPRLQWHPRYGPGRPQREAPRRTASVALTRFIRSCAGLAEGNSRWTRGTTLPQAASLRHLGRWHRCTHDALITHSSCTLNVLSGGGTPYAGRLLHPTRTSGSLGTGVPGSGRGWRKRPTQ
jgi:hypothetical protein